MLFRSERQYYEEYGLSENINRNVEFVSLESENFLSYKKLNIDFDKFNYHEPIAILGKNEDTKGSNGAGKSSILEVIYWGLYGETLRGSKVDSVVNRAENKNCFVNIKLKVNGEEYSLKRYRKHHKKGNRFYLNDDYGDANVLGSWVEKNIVKSSTFKNIAIIDGNISSFSKLRPSERKEIMDKILGFDVYEEKRKEIINRESEMKSNIDKHQLKIDLSTERIKNLTDEKNNLERAIENFKKDYEEKKAKIKEEMAELRERIVEEQQISEKYKTEIVLRKDRIKRIEEKISDYKNKLRTCENKYIIS